MKNIINLMFALLICSGGVSCSSNKAPTPAWANTMVENISNGMNQNIVASQLRAQQLNTK